MTSVISRRLINRVAIAAVILGGLLVTAGIVVVHFFIDICWWILWPGAILFVCAIIYLASESNRVERNTKAIEESDVRER